MALFKKITDYLTGSTGVVKNPLYDPNNQASSRYVDRSQLTIGLNPTDQKIEKLSGSTKLSDMLQMNTSNLLGNTNVSPAWRNALSGYSIGANGQLVQTSPQQTQTNTRTQPGQVGANTVPNTPNTVSSTGRATSITAPQQTVPSYDPSVTGTAIDPTRLNGEELKDLATRAGQAGLSLDDYIGLVNQNAGLTSEDSAGIREELGIDAARDKALAAPTESLEDMYRNLYKNVGLNDVKKSIAELDARINQKRDDFNKVEGEIRNNPWLSSASRRGRLKNAAELALADIENDLVERQQALDLYDQGVSEIERQIGFAISDRNLQRELDTEQLNFLLNEAERREGLAVNDKAIQGLRNVPDFIQGRRDEQLRQEALAAAVSGDATGLLENATDVELADLETGFIASSDLTSDQAKKLDAIRVGEKLVDQIEDLYWSAVGGEFSEDGTLTGEYQGAGAGVFSRVKGVGREIGQFAGLNQKQAIYENFLNSNRAPIAKGIKGESGNLAENEQKQALKAFPSAFASPEEAQAAFANIRQQMRDQKGLYGNFVQPVNTSGANGQATPEDTNYVSTLNIPR